MNWLPITYRDFYDIPRAFVVERDGDLYLFNSLFDSDIDDYSNDFVVYRLPREAAPKVEAGSWEGLAGQGQLVGHVPTKSVEFDPSRRASVNEAVFDRIARSSSFRSASRPS